MLNEFSDREPEPRRRIIDHRFIVGAIGMLVILGLASGVAGWLAG